jgi:hypothetical protein
MALGPTELGPTPAEPVIAAGGAVFRGRRVLWGSAAVALLGWVGVAIGWQVARVETHFAYLTAFAFVTSIALGALVFLMTTYVVGASWNTALRRLNECLVSVFPVLALAFAPIALGLGDLYPWTRDPASIVDLSEHERHVLSHKQAYLNAPFFLGRAALYFVIWTAVAFVLCRRSTRRDRATPTASAVEQRAERSFSAATLPLVALALTFAAFDWLMSLQPFWMSSIFGVYLFAGGFVASLGLVAVLAHVAARSGSAPIRPPHFHALGRLMLGFTVFWAYIAFFQALLMALPNRPEEVVFYLQRLDGGWRQVAWVLVAVRFVIPFFVLLPRSIKFRGGVLAWVGAGLVVGHYVDMYWLVIPVQSGHGPLPGLWDVAALCALGGTASWAAAAWLRGKALVPIGDPLLARSIAYRSPI